jgi:predicted ATPase
MADQDVPSGHSHDFELQIDANRDRVQVDFVHSGEDLFDVRLYGGYMIDEWGVAQAGDGPEIEGVARDVRLVIYDQSRVDASSISADLPVGFDREQNFLAILTWRAARDPAEICALGVKGSLDQTGGFSINEEFRGGNAIQVLLDSNMINESDPVLSQPPAPEGDLFFTELSVAGFRGFAEKRALRLSRPTGEAGSGLTVIVGANNSGKSTFLEALHSLARGRQQTELSFPQPRRHRDLDAVELELRRNDGVSLEVHSVRSGSSQAKAIWKPDGIGNVKFDIHLTPSRRNFSPYFGTTGIAERNWSTLGNELSRTDLREQFVGRLRKVDRDDVARAKFDALLGEIVGYQLNWTFDELAPNQQFVKLIESDGAWHTSEGLGDGLISMLFVVDALYDSEPGALIAIDEPELSLHPQLIRRLRRVLSRYAADRQILIATHSPLLLDWSDIAKGATIARVYKKDGHSEVAQVSSETLTKIASLTDSRNPYNPHVVGAEAREAFFLEDGVTITEGQDDVTFLARVLDDLGISQPENLYGWGAGGVTNIPNIAQLFVELGFTSIGVILDGDGQKNTEDAFNQLEKMAPLVKVRKIPAPDIRYKKPVSAKSEVKGLLDDENKHVRPELREAATEALKDVLEHDAKPKNTEP